MKRYIQWGYRFSFFGQVLKIPRKHSVLVMRHDADIDVES